MQGYRLGHKEGTPTNPKVHAPLRSWRHLLQNLEAALLSNSEIHIPRNALAPTLLPNLKYKFPKQKYKILKSRRTYKLDRELYTFL